MDTGEKEDDDDRPFTLTERREIRALLEERERTKWLRDGLIRWLKWIGAGAGFSFAAAEFVQRVVAPLLAKKVGG